MIQVTQFMRRARAGNFSIERIYEDVRAHLPADIAVSLRVNQFESRGFWRRCADMIFAKRYEADVNHVTGDVHYVTYLLKRSKNILTVHDCGTLERLSGIRRWIYWFFWFWLPIRRCAAVVVVSETTKQHLLRIVKYDSSKVHVIPNHVSAEFKATTSQPSEQSPRLLQIGTKKNKNLFRVAEALEGIDCTLVIVGKLNDEQKAALERHKIHYESLSNLSRESLVDEYRKCHLVVFASTYEGFGLPIVEANAIGRPVLTSNISSMPEVAGDAACFVDPYSVSSIRAGMLSLLSDADLRARLIQRGFENVERFRIETVARRYADLYRSVATSAARTTR